MCVIVTGAVIVTMAVIVFSLSMFSMTMLSVIMFSVVMMPMFMRIVAAIRTMHMPGLIVAHIGAAFRVKRRFDVNDPAAQRSRHALQLFVLTHANAVRKNLQGYMQISQAPRQTRQIARLADAYLRQGFRRRDHLDQTAIFEHKRIAAPQHDVERQVHGERQTVGRLEIRPSPVPTVRIQQN